MTCPLGHEAVHYRIAHPMTAVPMDIYRCVACRRELVNGTWLRSAGFCDGCDEATWRFAAHPKTGLPLLLWPKGDTRLALIATPGALGEKAFRDYCPRCCPAFGEPAKRPVEVGGQAIATGACVGWERPQDRYADRFSERQREFLAAWLVDHMAFSDEERDAALATWERDRDYAEVAA